MDRVIYKSFGLERLGTRAHANGLVSAENRKVQMSKSASP